MIPEGASSRVQKGGIHLDTKFGNDPDVPTRLAAAPKSVLLDSCVPYEAFPREAIDTALSSVSMLDQAGR